MQHQLDGIDWLRQRDRALLADEPGLGKTVQLLHAAKEPVLAIAPAMVLDSGTWDDEVARWAPDLDITQAPYSNLTVRNKNGRIFRDHNGFPIVELKPELKRRWGTVICDESHYLKGRKTGWTAAVEQLSKSCCSELKQATGTPIPNWAHEAFTTLRMLYPEEAKPGRTYGSYWRWVNEWFEVEESYYNPQAKEIGSLKSDLTWEEFRSANWRDKLLLRLRADCLDLPPLTRQRFVVDMTTEQARVYKQLKKDFVAWLDSGIEVEAWSSSALMVKLCKVATGLELLDPTAKPSGKLLALKELLTDRPRPTLVVAHFQDSVDACARVAEKAGHDVGIVRGGIARSTIKKSIRDFQQGNLSVLCASIEMIAEGMTLHQGGADQTIFVERSWRPSRNEQVLRRLHRMGLVIPVSAIDLVTRGSYDIKVLAAIEAKTDEQMQALGVNELKSML